MVEYGTHESNNKWMALLRAKPQYEYPMWKAVATEVKSDQHQPTASRHFLHKNPLV